MQAENSAPSVSGCREARLRCIACLPRHNGRQAARSTQQTALHEAHKAASASVPADTRFGSTVGQFCLLAALRAQVAPGRDEEFKEVNQER